MILGGRQGHDRDAAGQREERDFLAVHELFDHDARPGAAEFPPLEALRDGGVRLGQRGADDGALAGRQSVGLHHARRAELAAEPPRRHRIIERPESRGGNPVAGHEVLGEGLGALDRRGTGAGAEDRQPALAQAIGQTRHQRHLGSDDDQVDVVASGEAGQAIGVVQREIETPRMLGDPRVARRRPQMLDERTLGDLPGERVLATAGADEEDPHSGGPPGGSSTSRWARAIRAHGLPESSSR